MTLITDRKEGWLSNINVRTRSDVKKTITNLQKFKENYFTLGFTG